MDVTTLQIMSRLIADKSDEHERIEQEIMLLQKRLQFHQGNPWEINEQIQQKHAELDRVYFDLMAHIQSLIEYVEEGQCALNLQ